MSGGTSGRAGDGGPERPGARAGREPAPLPSDAEREPTPSAHENTQSHAGNGTVNHGPGEPEGKGRAERPGTGLDGPGESGPDEQDLRRLLHSAVDGIEPRGGTLEHLRRAVPARRARKRQAAVGMAAMALFLGTAIPAAIHVSRASGSPDTAMAGNSSEAHGGTGGRSRGPDGGSTAGTGGAQGQPTVPGKDRGKDADTGSPDPGDGTTAGTDPSSTLAAGAPACSSAQLGPATQSVAAPDSTGAVYGTFRVVNTSGTACSVTGPGSIGVSALGAADPARVTGVRHVAGDAAGGLPVPSLEVAALVLQPGGSYQEKFAFVPSATCPVTGGSGGGDTGGTTTGGAGGGSGDPTPDPTASQDADGATGGSDSSGDAASGTGPQLVMDGTPAPGSVVVTHTGAAGTTVSATVPDACAGTVYYTGLLAGE